jgi:hypothetical protein
MKAIGVVNPRTAPVGWRPRPIPYTTLYSQSLRMHAQHHATRTAGGFRSGCYRKKQRGRVYNCPYLAHAACAIVSCWKCHSDVEVICIYWESGGATELRPDVASADFRVLLRTRLLHQLTYYFTHISARTIARGIARLVYSSARAFARSGRAPRRNSRRCSHSVRLTQTTSEMT